MGRAKGGIVEGGAQRRQVTSVDALLASDSLTEKEQKHVQRMHAAHLPEQWMFDGLLCSPQARTELSDISVLREYVASRLPDDCSLLTKEGVLSAAKAREVAGHPNDVLAQAVMRAANLLRAREDALAHVSGTDEEGRTAKRIAENCKKQAQKEVADPGNLSLRMRTIIAWSLADSLSSDHARPLRELLYDDDGDTERYRSLLAKEGYVTAAPLAFFNGKQLSAYRDTSLMERTGGIALMGGHLVGINSWLSSSMREAREHGAYHNTIVHEMVHTVQGELENPPTDKEDFLVYRQFLEGSTEVAARMLSGQPDDWPDWQTWHTYPEETDFMIEFALAASSEEGSPDVVISELARCPNEKRIALAASLLLGGDSKQAQLALKDVTLRCHAAYWEKMPDTSAYRDEAHSLLMRARSQLGAEELQTA